MNTRRKAKFSTKEIIELLLEFSEDRIIEDIRINDDGIDIISDISVNSFTTDYIKMGF